MGNTLPPIPPPPIPDEQQQEEEQQQQQLGHDADGNPLFTCQICIEPMPIAGNRFRNGDACSHPFCTDCVVKYIRVKLEDDATGVINCPAYNCKRTLDPLACAALVGDSLFVRWCDVLCEASIVDLVRCSCPHPNCNVLIVNECGGTARKSSCPSCKRWFCFHCSRVWHAGFGCEESGELRDRNDVAFGRLAEQKQWTRCPRCRHFVELMEGCQIVKCRCGISFCYKCGRQVKQHWCRCDATSMCCELCFRACVVLIFLTMGLFFLSWEAGKFL
ncbi:E3 ubiquitin-protein ligase RSL1-like [Andrographis paniculata]|uniref:E3 ubiquitin-protein ligase RSL1-like n=1 Tax=Andrographis paniculata TaxID=175694 RepID=UPI0021E80302|nr:E3 ubiquitin-protein ligase RSL1-like [Andrographis paniculata]